MSDKHKERRLSQQTKNTRSAWLGKFCEICGKKRANHTRQQAKDCENAIANDPYPRGRDY